VRFVLKAFIRVVNVPNKSFTNISGKMTAGMDLSPDTPIEVRTNCESVNDARKIGRAVLEARAAACFNIIPYITSMYFWPPKTDAFEEDNEVTLILKTIVRKYDEVEEIILKHHPYITPFIAALPYTNMSKKYKEWLVGELQ
jgi:periplasmic divalent cation tolerance protein